MLLLLYLEFELFYKRSSWTKSSNYRRGQRLCIDQMISWLLGVLDSRLRGPATLTAELVLSAGRGGRPLSISLSSPLSLPSLLFSLLEGYTAVME